MFSPRRWGAVCFAAGLSWVSLAVPSAAQGSDVERTSVISLNSYTLDIREPALELPDGLAATTKAANSYLLVKYASPVSRSQYAALEAATAKIYTYLPHDTYLVRVEDQAAAGFTLKSGGASWVGPYHPAYKIAPVVQKTIAVAAAPGAEAETRIVLLHLFPDSDLDAVLAELERLGVPGVVGSKSGERFSRIRLLLTDEEIVRFRQPLAQLPAVFWIDRERRLTLFNDTTISVAQAGVNAGGATPIFDQGIFGEGQIIGVLDTGIDADMCYFRDPALGLPPTNACNGGTTVDLNQRKVIAVDFLWGNECSGGISGGEWDTQDHGTHVAGIAAGDNFANPLIHDPGDGMAPGAKLVIQDCGFQTDNCADCPGIGCPVVDLKPIFQQAFDQGARIHTNSWGDQENTTPQNNYTAGSQDADDVMWNNKDLLILFAAGNSGPGSGSVGSPSTAKSVISVGATQRGSSAEGMASFSSCGPTQDGRIKPDLTMPGQGIVSANADRSVTSNNCNTRSLSGTSMAAPGAAGMAALVRQYFTDGFHPSGAANAPDGFTPTAALVKATLLNSAQEMSGVSAPIPSNCQGWGRVLLDNALHFTGQNRSLFVEDDRTGFPLGSSSEERTFTLTVNGGSEPLKATLAWTDFPSTPAANPNLNNDLDLVVSGPSGTLLGNVFSGGQSTGGGSADRLNTVEQVLIDNPIAGQYTITVRSFNVPDGPQPFALAVTGDLSTCNPPAAPTGVSATAEGNGEIRVSWNAVPGASSYRVFRSAGNSCPGGAFSLLATVDAPATSFLDTGISGGQTNAYQVTAATACESAPSACTDASATGTCSASPTFGGLGSVSDTGSSSCALNLSWSAATSGCAANPDVTYTVFRSATSGFTPGPANQIASCVSGTSFLDGGVDFDVDYFYVVRAEDSGSDGTGACNGGNVDANTVQRSSTPTGGRTQLHAVDFESGAAGWAHSAADSSCTTGDWGVGNPDGVTTGGIVTQLEDDNTPAPGVNALFTAPNPGGAGSNDVDGGVCTALSPSVDASAFAGAEISLFYYHGQRDAGDDGAGDFFRIDLSNDGGSTFPTNLAAIGDVTSSASWTLAQTTVSNPGQLRLRVQASDGAGPGDLVEGGVDDVLISGVLACGAGGPCTTPPSFGGASAATDGEGASCSVTVSWAPGSNGCPENPDLTYTVFRSTSSGFIPGPANQIATCITGTSFVDTSATFGNTFFYVVRAEDSGSSGAGPCNGGNLEGNTVEISASPTGGSTVLHSADFESGAAGWLHSAADSSCSTGDWGVGNPDGVTSSGVVTQLEDDHTPAPGVNAFFTEPNAGGAGSNDVDGGVCTALSPVIDASGGGPVAISLFYYHGQRDAGDDGAGDFFRIDLSNDGGSTFPTSLVTLGDVQSNAVWTEAQTTVASPGLLQLRVQASDGAGPGDLIEGGLDDVLIRATQACTNP